MGIFSFIFYYLQAVLAEVHLVFPTVLFLSMHT